MVLQAHAKEPIEGKYLSLTSFRRDGSAVATPVWIVAENGHLLVETDADSYKVKRIRRDAHVRIAACDARGRLRCEPVDAEARILPNSERETRSRSDGTPTRVLPPRSGYARIRVRSRTIRRKR
jgi:PPOX class probable F420-dependent enzyme